MTTLPSGLPEEVGDGEDLARFLTQSGHYAHNRVRPNAFMPNTKDRSTSVSRHGREPLGELQELGAAAAGDRHLHGVAFIKAVTIRTFGLTVGAAEPPPRHALICGWAWAEDDPRQRKAERLEKAQSLAVAAGKPLLFVP